MALKTLLPRGIYTPLPTFFLPDESLDIPSFKSHLAHVVASGTYPVLAGSAGEAPHLTPAERSLLVSTARSILPENYPLVANISAPSTRETISLAHGAAQAGADFGMVLAPGYYASVLKDKTVLKDYFCEVARNCPIPVVVYNFPGVSGGVDVDEGVLGDVARETEGKVVGVKMTCGNVGRMGRLCARTRESEFVVICGWVDILVAGVAVGAGGAISGLCNLAPKTCVRLWELCCEDPTGEETMRLQGVLALAEGFMQGIGVAGMKWLVHKKFGYHAKTRRPLPTLSDEAGEALWQNEYLQAVLLEEERL